MYSTIPCQITFLPLFIFSFSNQLQLLIFLIRHLDYSSLSSFTNQGPFVWKHEDKNRQQKPLKAILMLCLYIIYVINYQIGVNLNFFYYIYIKYLAINLLINLIQLKKIFNVFHFWWSLFSLKTMFAKVCAGKWNEMMWREISFSLKTQWECEHFLFMYCSPFCLIPKSCVRPFEVKKYRSESDTTDFNGIQL